VLRASATTPPLLVLCLLAAPGCTDDSAVDHDADASAEDAREDGDGEGTEDSAGEDAAGDGDGGAACGACHGTPEHPNPPPDLSGASGTTSPGVGAHERHLAESTRHAAVRCTHCHPVPGTVDAAGHVDAERPADVVFSGLAARDCTPRRSGGTCTVYCHGAAMRVAPRDSAAWTTTGTSPCGSCHDLPPAAPHPAAGDCGRCHLEVADESGAIVEGAKHIDSILAAPHGAHIVHLGGDGGPEYACTECHPDGHAYHGPLRDGRTLEDTTVCDPCHAAGTVGPEAWRGYAWGE
jgi:hypothetical protein